MVFEFFGPVRCLNVRLPRLVNTLKLLPEVFYVPKTRPPYSPEFRRQMVDLVRADRDPDDLAREFKLILPL